MLIPYQKRQKDEDFAFDVFSVEIAIEKEQKKKVKNVFKTNVSSQKIRMRKEEGATVGVCRPFCLPYLSSAGWFVRPDGSVSTESLLYRKAP